jgi:hypothetical protein
LPIGPKTKGEFASEKNELRKEKNELYEENPNSLSVMLSSKYQKFRAVFTPCGHVRAEPLLIMLSLLLLYLMRLAPMSTFIGSLALTQCVLLAGAALSSKTDPMDPTVLMAVVIVLWLSFFGTTVNLLLYPSYWRGVFGHVHEILYPNDIIQKSTCTLVNDAASPPESNRTLNWRFEIFLITAFSFFAGALLHTVFGTLFARSSKDIPHIRFQMIVILTCSAIRWSGSCYYELVDPEYMGKVLAFNGPFR